MKKMKLEEAEKFIEKFKGVVYLWFGTEWCGDCHMMEPIIEDVEQTFSNSEQVIFIKVDAEEANVFRTKSKYQVKRVPTHVFIKNNEIKKILYEYVPEEDIVAEITKLKHEQ